MCDVVRSGREGVVGHGSCVGGWRVVQLEHRVVSDRWCAACAVWFVVQSWMWVVKVAGAKAEERSSNHVEQAANHVKAARSGTGTGSIFWSAASKSNGHHCGEGQRQRRHHGREAAGESTSEPLMLK